MSTFTLSPTFPGNITSMIEVIGNVTFNALDEAMQEAENDARNEYRWREDGSYSEVDQAGNTWEWEVTGVARDSITAFTIGQGRDSRHFPSASSSTAVTRTTPSGFVTEFNHEEGTDESLITAPSPKSGEIIGVLTMDFDRIEYLQGKEISGGTWGTPGPGQPVTIDALENNMSHYITNIIEPGIGYNFSSFAKALS